MRTAGGIAGPSRIGVVGAASSIGIRPYDDRPEPRRLDEAPDVLRSLGLVARLGAVDLGTVRAAAYRDFVRPRGGVRNEAELVDYSRALAERVELALAEQDFALVLGGDCSIVLGSLLGARRHAPRLGLVYIDAHADFASPSESITGSAASMCLAMAVGRGASPLARMAGAWPLVDGADVALLGRRDDDEPYYGQQMLANLGLLDLPDAVLSERGAAAVAAAALDRVARPDLDGFWIHVDADVLDPQVMPAVDSPARGGPDVGVLAAMLRPLTEHPKALGMQLTIYDPALDPARESARKLATLLERVLATNEWTGGLT
jgi:arginase